MPGRGSRGAVLGAATAAWIVWCLIAPAAVTLVVRAAVLATRRADLISDVPLGVAIEVLLLAASAFAIFRPLRRLDPPAWFWLVAPGGYAASYGIYLLLERVTVGAAIALTPGTVLEILAVCALTAAGAYLGGMRREPAVRGPRDAGGPAA